MARDLGAATFEMPLVGGAGWASRWLGRRLILAGMVAAIAFPFFDMVSTAFKPPDQVFTSTLLPTTWSGENFALAIDQLPVGRYLVNTLIISLGCVCGTLVSCPLVAYSLSKIRWSGARPVLFLVLAVMMLPPQVTMIPVYLMWNGAGLTDSYWPLIVPAFLGTPFLIFMIRQFLMQVPDELVEAASLDGASPLRTYWSIVLPLARPALIAAAVFQFVWTWTDFLTPLIYLNDSEKYTLSIGLYAFFSEHDVAWGPLMAACSLFTLPALAVFLLAQRYFIGGVGAGALK